MQRIRVRLLGTCTRLDVAVIVVLDRLAGIRQQGLVDLGPDAPGGALQRERLSGGELEADELAAGGEQLGHALCPLGAFGGL